MKLLLMACSVLLSVSAWAQDSYYKNTQPKPAKRQYTITLQDGSKLRGELIRQDSTEAVIKTGNLGQVTVKSDQILSMVAIGSDKANEPGYPNLFPQYLILTPTAYTAERGKLYFRNSYLYYSQFDYGINDNWSIGAGFFTFVPTAIFSLNTKVSFPISKTVRLGVQGQYINGDNTLDGLNGVNYVQALASVGTSQRNVTIGIGTSFAHGRFSEAKILTVGIVRKVSSSLTFISENHIVTGSNINANVTFSGGLRFDRRRHSFDLSAVVPISPNSSPSIFIFPFVAYQLRISK